MGWFRRENKRAYLGQAKIPSHVGDLIGLNGIICHLLLHTKARAGGQWLAGLGHSTHPQVGHVRLGHSTQ